MPSAVECPIVFALMVNQARETSAIQYGDTAVCLGVRRRSSPKCMADPERAWIIRLNASTKPEKPSS